MHKYAVFGHDRVSIGRWLGIAAIAIAGGTAHSLAWLNSLTGFEAFTKTTLSTGLAYFILHWAFNKYAWKLPFFSIPDLNGIWKLEGKTLDENGCEKYHWEGFLDIEQTWNEICLNLKTKKSQSNSYTATLSKHHGNGNGWTLTYSYKNDPTLSSSHLLNSHKGFCEIEIDNELTKGTGSYFNSNGRKTVGVIVLERKQP